MLKDNGKRVKKAKAAPRKGPNDSNAHFRELAEILESWGK